MVSADTTHRFVCSISADYYKESLIQQYPDLFKDIGKLQHHKAKFYINIFEINLKAKYTKWRKLPSKNLKSDHRPVIKENTTGMVAACPNNIFLLWCVILNRMAYYRM